MTKTIIDERERSNSPAQAGICYGGFGNEGERKLGEVMANRIKDSSGDRTYWVQTPLLVWALTQDPYDLALWFTIKAVAGEDRECILSTEDLAVLSMMSVGKVSQCRARLIELGLLEGEVRRDPEYPQPVWHLTIPDIWEANVSWAKKHASIKAKVDHKALQKAENEKRKKSLHQVKEANKEPSPREGGGSPREGGGSPREGGGSPREGGGSPREATKIIYRSDQDQSKIDEDPGAFESERARAATPTPPTTTPTASAPATKTPRLSNDSADMPQIERVVSVTPKRGRPNANTLSPHVKGAAFTKAGTVERETGANPVAIYYEFYSIYDHKLAGPVEDDLPKTVTDLALWRQIVTAWQQCDHKPTNIKGMLDWYKFPARIPGSQPTGPSTNGNAPRPTDLSYKEWLLQTYGTTIAAMIKPESELQDEYKQWRLHQGLSPGI